MKLIITKFHNEAVITTNTSLSQYIDFGSWHISTEIITPPTHAEWNDWKCNWHQQWFLFVFTVARYKQFEISTVMDIYVPSNNHVRQLFIWIKVWLGLYFSFVALRVICVLYSGHIESMFYHKKKMNYQAAIFLYMCIGTVYIYNAQDSRFPYDLVSVRCCLLV